MSARVVCLGDSITEGLGDEKGKGWVGRLADHLALAQPGAWLLNNLGVAGDTSIDINHRLRSEVMWRSPVRLIVAAGLNDATRRLWPEAAGDKVDFSYARDIWRQILGIIQKNGFRTIFVGLTPVNEAQLPLVWMPYDADDHGHSTTNAAVQKYEAMLGAEVRRAGFPFIPLFERLSQTDYAAHLVDGMHPDAHGYDLMTAILTSALEAEAFWETPRA